MASKPEQRFTHEQRRIRARMIKEEYKRSSLSFEELAVKYQLSASMVYKIVNGTTPKRRGAK